MLVMLRDTTMKHCFLELGNIIHILEAKPSSGFVLDIVLPLGCHIGGDRYSSERPTNAGYQGGFDCIQNTDDHKIN